MPLGGLQHFTIEPQDLEKTKEFYVDVLGLENGNRPPLDFPGYWLYSGGQATVHLMGTRKPRRGHCGARYRAEIRGHRPPRPYCFCRDRRRWCAQAPQGEERRIS